MRFGDIFFRDFIEINGIFYMLDMRYTMYEGNECMAFRCARPGEPCNRNDVWSKRGMQLTRREFNKCKREFMEDMRRRNHVQN